jgi:hypothetical protein
MVPLRRSMLSVLVGMGTWTLTLTRGQRLEQRAARVERLAFDPSRPVLNIKARRAGCIAGRLCD